MKSGDSVAECRVEGSGEAAGLCRAPLGKLSLSRDREAEGEQEQAEGEQMGAWEELRDTYGEREPGQEMENSIFLCVQT